MSCWGCGCEGVVVVEESGKNGDVDIERGALYLIVD